MADEPAPTPDPAPADMLAQMKAIAAQVEAAAAKATSPEQGGTSARQAAQDAGAAPRMGEHARGTVGRDRECGYREAPDGVRD